MSLLFTSSGYRRILLLIRTYACICDIYMSKLASMVGRLLDALLLESYIEILHMVFLHGRLVREASIAGNIYIYIDRSYIYMDGHIYVINRELYIYIHTTNTRVRTYTAAVEINS
jgi:hypothetical protein